MRNGFTLGDRSTRFRLLPTLLAAFLTAGLGAPGLPRLIANFVILAAYHSRTVLFTSAAALFLFWHLLLSFFETERLQNCSGSLRPSDLKARLTGTAAPA